MLEWSEYIFDAVQETAYIVVRLHLINMQDL